MTKDLIITLDNNIEYVLLEEQVLDNKKIQQMIIK